MNITWTDKISVEDYQKLRASAGWSLIHPEQAESSIKNSAFLIAAYDSETAVGMARLVSDGGYIFLVADVLVLSAYQRQGLGKMMMAKVMDYIRSQLKDGYKIQVNLMATKDRESFYEGFGFERRPTEQSGSGMMQWVKG